MKNLALHILDLAENSVRAKAGSIEICIDEERDNDCCRLTILDDGAGMEAEQLLKASEPFFTTRNTRKVGLGLPLVRQNAERTGGSFSLFSEPGKGTRLEAAFGMSHPDMLPLGEIDDVLVLLMVSHPRVRLVYEHRTPSGSYRFDSEAIRDVLGNARENNQEIRKFLREMVTENLAGIKCSL